MLDKFLNKMRDDSQKRRDYDREVSPSAAHAEFLSSGCKCSNCKKELKTSSMDMNAPIVGLRMTAFDKLLSLRIRIEEEEEWGTLVRYGYGADGGSLIKCNCNCYSVDGSKINDENSIKNSMKNFFKSRLAGIFKGMDISEINELECPYCGHRWLMFQKSKRIIFKQTKETRTSEEFIGEEKRVIDNLQNSSEITRTIEFTKEWSKLSTIEDEKIKVDGIETTLGPEFLAVKGINIKKTSQETIKKKYSIAEGEKETFKDGISFKVESNKQLTLVIKWKNIYQHGLIIFEEESKEGTRTIEIPFKILVRIAFDSKQI